jgi:hypothetical protein
MKRLMQSLLVAAIASLCGASLLAYQLAMKDGRIVEFKKYRVEGERVFYTDAGGKEVSLALADVDVERTKTLNAKESPPLDLSAASTKLADNAAADQAASSSDPPSLGDAARALRKEGKAHPAGQKHAYTDDDMAHAPSGELQTLKPEAKESPEAGAATGNSGSSTAAASTTTKRRAVTDQEVSEYYDLGREDTARALLAKYDVPPDTPFPDRSEWEFRLYEAKQELVHAYFHYKERPDDELADNRMVNAWNAFAKVGNEGLAKARAYLKDHPQQ